MPKSEKSGTPRRQDAQPPRRTRIKICGVRDARIAEAVIESGADMVGFVFIEASPRYLDYGAAKDIVEILPNSIKPVALVNHLTHRSQFYDLHHRSSIDCVQLHGDEAPGLAATMPDCPLLRAFPADKAEDVELLASWAFHDNVEAFLWDAPASPNNPLGGGSGHRSDWQWLSERLPTSRPSILAGGLTPGNVGDAIRTVRPWAVDVSSGVESSRGVKDPAMIADFCAAVRAADQL